MAAIQDPFTRANNVDLGANWTPINGSCQVSGNRVRGSSGAGMEMWNANTFGTDHYSQTVIYLNSAGFFDVGPAVRMANAGGGECYYVRACASCGDLEMHKRVGFADSAIASGGSVSTSTPVAAFTLKLGVVGSTLTAYIGGSSVFSTSDTSLTSNTGCGLVNGPTTGAGEQDDWEADVIGASAVTRTGSISGTGTLNATGKIKSTRTASITGTGTLNATGKVIVKRTGSLSGTGTLNGTGAVIHKRTASMVGASTFSATGLVLVKRTGSLTGTGVLNATGRTIIKQTGSLTGIGTLTGAGVIVYKRTGSISGLGTLNASGMIVHKRTGSVTGTSSITGTGNVVSGVVQRTGSINGTSTLTAYGSGPSDEGTLELGIFLQLYDPLSHIKKTTVISNPRIWTKV